MYAKFADTPVCSTVKNFLNIGCGGGSRLGPTFVKSAIP